MFICVLFLNKIAEETLDNSGIQTRTDRVEGERADHHNQRTHP